MPRKLREPNYRLEARGGGIWYIVWWNSEKRKPERVSCHTRSSREAEDALATFRADLLTPAVPAQPTLRDILDSYERTTAPGASASLPFTVAALRAGLGGLKPTDLSPEVVQRYYATRKASGRRLRGGARQPLSDGTLIREGVILRAALAHAVGRGWITKAPYIAVPPQPQPRDRWLTREEFDRLLAACDALHVRLFVVLALATAGRRGAILELKWAAISDVVDLGKSNKNKRRAIVPLTTQAKAALAEAKNMATTDWVFEWRGAPVKSVRTGFEAACRRAGLKNVTAHVLRHSAATWMAIAGVPLSEIARFLGDSERTVEKVYAKHTPGYLSRAAAALEIAA
jgi:integrase